MSRGRYYQGALRSPARRTGAPRRMGLYVVALLVTLALCAFFSSAYFRVESVEVSGNLVLGSDEVISSSGIVIGTSLLSLRVRDIQAQVEMLPYVRTARVIREFPSRVRISIDERTPVGYLLVDGTFLAVDREGVILEAWHGAFLPDEPVITCDLPGDMVPGDQLKGHVNLEIFRVLGLMGEDRDSLSEINVKENQVTMYTMDGIPVFLGVPDALVMDKFLVLPGILDDARREGVTLEYIDLRTSRPVVRPKEGFFPVYPREDPEEPDAGIDW